MIRDKLNLDTIINKYHKALLGSILLLSFFLNTSYVSWGLPGYWHPDEAIEKSMDMFNHWTLNPNFFDYPNLHFYLLLFTVLAPLFAVERIVGFLNKYPSVSNLVPDFRFTNPISLVITNHITLIYVISRVLSAIMGVATVLLVYLIAKKIFNKNVGLLSAAFLAITAGFVNLAHFSTVDIPLTFWCTLSFFLLLLAYEKGTPFMYALAGLSVGLTASTKYTGILMSLPLIVAFVVETGKKPRENFWNYALNKNLFIIISTVLIGFFIGTPYALINFRVFLGTFIEVLFFQSSYAGIGQLGFIPHINNLLNIYGLFGAVSSLLGFCYLVYLLFIHKNPKLLFIIIAIAIIYISMGRMMFFPVRYIMPLVPLLTICGGKLIYDLQKSSTSKLKNVAFVILVTLSLVYTGAYTLSGIMQMKNDDRNLALNWILENASETAYIEGSPYGINIPEEYNNFIHDVKLPFASARKPAARNQRPPYIR